MPVSARVIKIAIAALLAAISAFLGYDYGQGRNADALRVAQSDLAVCKSAANANESAVADVARRLKELRERHEQMKRDGEAAIAARDAENQTLQDEAEALRSAIRETVHVDTNCADLAVRPVCAAVERRLWPAPAAADNHHAPSDR
jgi:hypothetical protein